MAVDRIIRLPELERLVSLDASTIRRKVAAGQFPPPLEIAPRAIGWKLSSIEEWMEGLTEATPARECVAIAKGAADAKRARRALGVRSTTKPTAALENTKGASSDDPRTLDDSSF